jgi:hypothetical protein
MRLRIASPLLSLALLGSSASADEPNTVVAGYCDWVTGAAHSERALLHSPDAVIRVSRDLKGPGLGIRAGLAYDAIDFYRGRLVGSRADAECERFRASHAYAMTVEIGAGETERIALSARAAVLEEALPRARELVAAIESALLGKRATLEELQATRLRADLLASNLAATRTSLAALGEAREPLRASRIAELLAELVMNERNVEAHEAKLRRAEAFHLTLNGGYEESTSIHRKLPAYGMLQLSYNLGNARQYRADARALDGRVRWARAREAGPDSPYARVMLKLRAELDSERQRFAEVALLRADVEARWTSLADIESDRVRRVRDHLWFDLTDARAQEAYLAARVRELEVAVAESAAPARMAAAGPAEAPVGDAQPKPID